MRSVTPEFENLLLSGRVRPAFKVYSWAPSVSIGDVVCQTAPAGFDLTQYVRSIKWSLDSMDLDLADPAGVFHPDYGEYRNYLKDGSTIRLVEGDSRIPESSWIISFTGMVTGQVGWKRNRESGELMSSLTAYGRQNNQAYQSRSIVSNKYTVGTDLGVMLSDICTGILGMKIQELRIPALLGYNFYHKVNQLVQVSPWDALEAILEVGCTIPFFDGEGKLAHFQKSINRTPDWILPDWGFVIEDEVPAHNGENYNYIEVIWLNPETSRVDGEFQKLCDANITTGFFTFEEKIDCYWSEDRKQRAHNTSMKTIKSVNANLLPVGTESYAEKDEYHGTITISISVWVPLLATAMLAEYVALAAVADGTESESSNKMPSTPITCPGPWFTLAGGGAVPITGSITIPPLSVSSTEDEGFTIPWGRIGQAQAMIVILAIMMSLGSAQYEIWGYPYDMVYEEMRTVALEDGLPYWREKRMKIENDFIGTQERSEDVAITELVYQHGQASPRALQTINYPGLEPGDIIETAWNQRFYVMDISKDITPGQPVTMSITAFKITGI